MVDFPLISRFARGHPLRIKNKPDNLIVGLSTDSWCPGKTVDYVSNITKNNQQQQWEYEGVQLAIVRPYVPKPNPWRLGLAWWPKTWSPYGFASCKLTHREMHNIFGNFSYYQYLMSTFFFGNGSIWCPRCLIYFDLLWCYSSCSAYVWLCPQMAHNDIPIIHNWCKLM